MINHPFADGNMFLEEDDVIWDEKECQRLLVFFLSFYSNEEMMSYLESLQEFMTHTHHWNFLLIKYC